MTKAPEGSEGTNPTTPDRRGPRLVGAGTVVFAVLAVGGGTACWFLAGRDVFFAAAIDSVFLLARIAPLILAAMLVGGYAQTLIPRERVADWLGGRSGLRGLALAAGLGAVTPGGPFTSFPMVYVLWRSGADLGTAIAYLTAWSVIGVHRLFIWEIPLLGDDLALLRYAVSLPLPFVAGTLARWLAARFPIEAPDREA
ncbi:MAG: permease [Alphaproteobacteria bacterium]